MRPDPTVVGTDEATGHVVRTSDNVGQFTSNQIGALLRASGARLDEAPVAVIETDLIEYHCAEAGKFNAAVAIRVTLRGEGREPWSKGFRGTASTWGKSHSPDNFNKALSGAVQEATEQLLQDEDFGVALAGYLTPLAPPSAAPAGQ